MISVLIVDDEPLGRERVRTLVATDPRLELVGECSNGAEAVVAIREIKPDLVFLDIQMPGLDGFGVIEEIGTEKMPAVIFVTAYDDYALKAFDVHAVDYLLKPFDPERFATAVDHALDSLSSEPAKDTSFDLESVVAAYRSQEKHISRLMIRERSRVLLVATSDIDWIEAAGNYVQIHVEGKIHLLRQTMASLEKALDPDNFLRIHRSTIVNLNRVKDLNPMFNGEYQVQLIDGTTLTLSRGYRNGLNRFVI